MPHLMINGVKQEFETFGDLHKPPLILVFGGATNPSTWRAWDYKNSIARLAEENYVIAFDHRGHGQSHFPQDSTLEDVAKDVFGLMDALCIEKANVVGMSAGTYVLGCAAGIAPERFNSMILVVPHSHSFGGSPATHLMRELGIDSATATPEQLAQIAKISFAPNVSDETVAEYNAFMASLSHFPPLPVEDCIAAYKSIANFDNRETYKNLKKPVLVMSGEYDRYCPAEVGKAIAESIDGGQYVEFKDCGHCLFWEKNDEAVDCIKEFLRTVNR